MIKPNEDELKVIETVEECVCSYFGINADKLPSRTKTLNIAMARAFVFYVLHTDYNISINKIANTYFRTPRLVNWQCEKIRYLIKLKNYAKMYNDIIEAMK